MRITTIIKNYYTYIILLVSLFGYNEAIYSQCPTVSNPIQTFCDTQTPTIASLVATNTGGGIRWYDTATSITPLSSSTGLINGEDYFADDNTGTCGARQSVVVTVYSAPTGANFQGVCVINANLATPSNPQFVINGVGLRWYTVPSGGTALSNSAPLLDNTIYYISQTNPNTGCETSRFTLFVNVGLVPTPSGSSVQEFCNVTGAPPTVADLLASGTNNWYLTPFFGISLDPTTLLVNGQSYYATTVDPPCESSTRLEVLVNLYEPNDAGTDGNRGICLNEIPSTSPFDLFGLLGGSPDITGVWSGPIATTNGYQGTLNVSSMTLAGSPYVFTYTVSSAFCVTDVSTVTITVLPLPSVVVSLNPTTICSGTSSALTFTGTPNATVTYNINGGSNQTIVLNSLGIATVSNTYTVNTTINVVSVESATIPSCVNTQISSAILTVIDPTASASFSPTTICANGNSTLTFTGTANATVTYSINGGANQTIVLNAAGTAELLGTYTVNTTVTLVSVTTAGSPSCTKALTQTVTLTVIDPTASASFSPTTICANGNSTLTFTGTANATVTYSINGGANQTIVLNAAGTAELLGTYTVNTTVTLVSVTTAGNPICTKALTETVTLTVIDPTAGASFSPTTICSNGNSLLTFTGTANATVAYSINGGANQTIVLNASGTATVPGTYAVNTTVTLVSVTTAGSPSCTKALTETVTLTVIDPTASASFSPTTICANGNSLLTFTGTPNATVTYSINGGANQTIVLNATGTATVPGTYTVNTTITLVSVTTAGSPSCTKALTQTVTLTVIDPTASASFSPTTICANGNSTLTFTGTANATVTYSINGGANQTIVLNAAGTAAVPGTYAVNTTVTLVSVTTAGSPICTKALTETVTLTVIDPTASASFSPTTICANGNSTLTFTGTANATVTYSINGGANQTIVLNASGTAELLGTYTVSTTVTLVSVTTAGSPSCTKALTQTVTLTVIDPTASASFSPTTICANGNSTLTFTGTANATVTYSINGGANQTIVLNAAGTAELLGTYTVNTTVTLISVTTAGSPSCTKALTDTVTLTVIDPTASASFSPTTICANGNSTLIFTGTANATVAYSINGGANQTIVLNASGTAELLGTYTVSTTVTLVSVTTAGSPICTKALTETVTLTVIDPTASASFSPTTICANGNSTLTFTGTANATVTYSINGGANQTIVLNAAGTAELLGTYTVNTTVTLVSVTTAGSPSCTKALTQTVTLTVIDPTASASFSPTTICANGNSVLTFTGTANATVTYSINGGANQTITLDSAGTATVPGTYAVNTTVTLVSVTTAGSSICTKALIETVILTVRPVPNAGNDANLPICSNQDPVDMFPLLGANAQTGGVWRDPSNAIVTNILNPATAVDGVYTYTVLGIAPCVDDVAQITVSIALGPEAGVSGPFSICGNVAPYDLFQQLGTSAQSGGVWTNPSNVVVSGIFNPAVDPIGNYTYTLTGTLPCSNDQAVITVSISPVPDAGTSTTPPIICSNDAPVNLFTLLSGTPQAGGVWTNSSNVTVSNIFNPAVGVSDVFTYTVFGGFGCTPDSATVTITVVQSPNAGIDGTLTTCVNTTNLNLLNGLDGTQGSGTFSDDNATGALSGTFFNPSLVLPGSYNFTYTVSGGVSPCLTDEAIVTVIVNPLPNTGTAIPPPSVCTSFGAIDLNTLLTGQDAGGTWSSPSPIDIGGFSAGTYTYTYSVTNSCGTDSEDVQFIVLPNPVLTTSNIANTSVCVGSDAVVNLSGMTDGTYSINYNLSGSNTLANQTTTITISGGIGSFTIPSASLPNTGSTTIAFNTIQDTSTTCQVTLVDIIATITVNPLVQINNTNIAVSSICFGSNAVVEITNAINLPDGVYQFNYSIPGGTPATGNSGDVTITGGVGQFTVPASVFAAVGNYTITISGISTISGCSNTSQDANITFGVFAPLTAGTAISPPSVCTSVGTIDLNTLLTGQDLGGTWSTSSPIDISSFAAGTYTYTYSVTNACGTDTEDVQFIILPNPVLITSNIANTSVCVGLDAVVNLSGMTDGTYSINYSLSGSNTLANQTITLTISGGTGSFTIPTASIPNTGTTTITFNTIQDTASTCQVTLVNIIATITVNPIVQIDNANIAVSSVCLGSNATVLITNATNLPDGIYQFAYTIPTGTPTTGNSGDITITGGVGQFTILASVFALVGSYTLTINGITTTSGCSNTSEDANITFNVVAPLTAGAAVTPVPSYCSSIGVLDLALLLIGQDAGGAWTDSNGQAVTSPLNIINFAAGTYSYTYTVANSCGTDTEVVQFTVLASPQLSTFNITTSPTCIGSNAVVSFNGLVDGTYTLNYDLSGSNTLLNQSVIVTIAAGIGSFTIPAVSIPNVGPTIISFTSIVNNATTCTNLLTNVTAQIIIRPIADIDSSNLTIATVCIGNNVVVDIAAATNLPDGVYQFNYSIPGATPVTGNSGNVTITAGAGQFTIPAATFTTAGNYTLTVTGIVAATGCTNSNENATANFTVDAIPNTTGATVSAQTTCVNFGSDVTISGANSLPNGTYSITYILSGANSGTDTISVTFTGGTATFTIPGTTILNNGATTITINDLTFTATTCGISGTSFPTATVTVAALPTPVLIEQGNLFCGLDVPAPTVADLSANIVGTPNVIWYNALTGGTAYSPSEVLINGTTYFGAVVSANGCESQRLPVTVDLTICDVIIPDGFSPNNDGINDTFEIPNLALLYPNFKLEIYNRYGNIVYKGNRNLPNWDGTTDVGGFNLGDKILSTGVYFYILDFNDGIKKAIQGRVYLNR
ncbi:gliding motility-associated C-terminal domain-containing protein [Flavobacterium sp.]|jgi:gliding motility-associated-like protein|uniref:T9SS type B sorting domain-containing protein n=1 Tax=Flavobacterium sp. TaxID=239 RepID=UPI0037C0AE39